MRVYDDEYREDFEDDDFELLGICDECGCDLDEIWYVGDFRLCTTCAFHAMRQNKKSDQSV